MSQDFQPGDYLIFQLEAGYGLLRLLCVDRKQPDPVWHISAYNELFPDIEMAEAALERPGTLTFSIRHHALTNRAFESTPVARLAAAPLTEDELIPLREWAADEANTPSDRSVRLLLGLR